MIGAGVKILVSVFISILLALAIVGFVISNSVTQIVENDLDMILIDSANETVEIALQNQVSQENIDEAYQSALEKCESAENLTISNEKYGGLVEIDCEQIKQRKEAFVDAVKEQVKSQVVLELNKLNIDSKTEFVKYSVWVFGLIIVVLSLALFLIMKISAVTFIGISSFLGGLPFLGVSRIEQNVLRIIKERIFSVVEIDFIPLALKNLLDNFTHLLYVSFFGVFVTGIILISVGVILRVLVGSNKRKLKYKEKL